MKTSLFVLVALVSVGAFASPAVDPEAIYQARFAKLMAGGIPKGYDPMEPVPGVSDVRPLPNGEDSGAEDSGLTVDGAALDRAEQYARENNSDAFIVWHKGKLQRETYFGDVSADTPLVTRSLSKPITALAVGRAIELGFIDSLDQPLADFITEWQGTPKAEMRVRHILDMRSGLLSQGLSPDPDSPWNRAYLSPVHESYIVEEYPLAAPPGSVYGYSNATADLVALLIERSTGQRYSNFIGQEIFSKIGAPGGEQWINRPGGVAHSGCCAYFPAETILRMALLLLNDGVVAGDRVLPEGYVAEMITPTKENPHYGLGVWIGGDYTPRRGYAGEDAPGPKVLHSEPYEDKDTYLFDGNSNQVVYIMPNLELVVLRMGGPPPKSPEWDNSFLPNVVARGVVARGVVARGVKSLPQ